jgi:hypothetical protein
MKSFEDLEQDIQTRYNSAIECLQTPFDIICNLCLFKNVISEPKNLENNSIAYQEYLLKLEIHNEKLDILQALFNLLGQKNILLYERFMHKLESRNVL